MFPNKPPSFCNSRLSKQESEPGWRRFVGAGTVSELDFYNAIYIKKCAICDQPYVSNLPPGSGRLICYSFECYLSDLRDPVLKFKKPEPIKKSKPARKRNPATRTIPSEIREKVLRRDKNKCRYCGKPAQCIDHVVPWSHGGSSLKISNLVAACNYCNSVFHDKLFESFKDKKAWISKTPFYRRLSEVGLNSRQT